MTEGQIKRIGEPRIDVCNPLSCKSFKVRHNYRSILKANKECDSELANIFDGELTANITHGLTLNGEGRGAHHGKFTLVAGPSGSNHLVGFLSGVTNAGTHHPPLSNCESCDITGHMEGRLVGEITKGIMIGARIFASYAILFNASKEFTDTIADGELEGVIVRHCTDESENV
jgi:hypothetical protein